jgi:hypothetical protein
VFSNISEEYVRKKEAQRELKRVKHLTAKQAARKKDNEMWEKNRMIRSGTVPYVSFNVTTKTSCFRLGFVLLLGGPSEL